MGSVAFVIGRAHRVRTVACLGVLLLSLLGGCSTSRCADRPWGRDVCLLPSFERVKWAACRAATDPYTWLPAAGAVVFGLVSDWDTGVSDWARRETPVFGSKANAKEGGIVTRDLAIAGAAATAFATPSGCPQHWGYNKAKAFPVLTAAALVPQGIALWTKKTTDRVRPNGKDDLSFPSTISAEAAAWSALARRNIRATPMPRNGRVGLEAGFAGLTALTAWSRVENGAHYPSDVLAGVALGNFTSLLIHDMFLGPSFRDFQLAVAPSRGGADIVLAYTTGN